MSCLYNARARRCRAVDRLAVAASTSPAFNVASGDRHGRQGECACGCAVVRACSGCCERGRVANGKTPQGHVSRACSTETASRPPHHSLLPLLPSRAVSLSCFDNLRISVASDELCNWSAICIFSMLHHPIPTNISIDMHLQDSSDGIPGTRGLECSQLECRAGQECQYGGCAQ